MSKKTLRNAFRPTIQASDHHLNTILEKVRRSSSLIEAYEKCFDKTGFDASKIPNLLSTWLGISIRASYQFKTVFAVIISKPVTSVSNEQSFGYLQHLLGKKRLKIGSDLLSCYYLMKFSEEYISLDCESNQKEKKISDFFAKTK